MNSISAIGYRPIQLQSRANLHFGLAESAENRSLAANSEELDEDSYDQDEENLSPEASDADYPGKALVEKMMHIPVVGRIVAAGAAFVSAMAGGFGILAMAAPNEEAQKELLEKTPNVQHLPVFLGFLAALVTLFKHTPKEKPPAA
ncbi:MAG TPA: hypothetical protein V6C52_02420 [Coleofasciculaceae cyanobacterium]|jgi:hypothetical protein